MKDIKGFENEYRYLSNFYTCDVPIRLSYDVPGTQNVRMISVIFPNSEAAFHAFKCFKDINNPTEHEIENFTRFTQYTPSEAKRYGRLLKINVKYWDSVKDQVMERVLTAKFNHNPKLRFKLVATGDAYLEETNDWNDTYWGVCDGIGQNKLGELLMKLRDKFKGN